VRSPESCCVGESSIANVVARSKAVPGYIENANLLGPSVTQALNVSNVGKHGAVSHGPLDCGR
jgi:hypothetical protein